jgi:hypothetical protein
MRKTYKLLKDLPEHRKGLVVQEACDDGDQEYVSLTHDASIVVDDYARFFGDNVIKFSRKAVEDQPQWFVEVFEVEPQYMTRDELDQWEAFKRGKTGHTTTAAQSPAKRSWTPAMRSAQSRRMKAYWKRKNAA